MTEFLEIPASRPIATCFLGYIALKIIVLALAHLCSERVARNTHSAGFATFSAGRSGKDS